MKAKGIDSLSFRSKTGNNICSLSNDQRLQSVGQHRIVLCALRLDRFLRQGSRLPLIAQNEMQYSLLLPCTPRTLSDLPLSHH